MLTLSRNCKIEACLVKIKSLVMEQKAAPLSKQTVKNKTLTQSIDEWMTNYQWN